MRMNKNRIIVTGERESFIVRVLVKKAADCGAQSSFVKCTIDDINAKLDDVALVVLYMEDDQPPKDNVLHYLIERMEEEGIKMIAIGQAPDIKHIERAVPADLIYHTYTRPVDNEAFAKTVSEYFDKIRSGEFKKSILIVDDDAQYLSLVREWLKGTYKVSMANSGLQAIKLLGKNKVDLILLDHEMPVTSGPQVLEMLRSDPETSSIPVMFLTGKGDKESVMSVVSLKPEGYFLKNIQKDELLEKLAEYFVLHR